MSFFLACRARAHIIPAFLLALLFVPARAQAQDAVERPPISQVFQAVLDVDRMTPVRLDIWRDQYVGYSGNTLASYAAYCLSEDDPATGACPTADTMDDPTSVRLRFREKRSGMVVDLTAEGTRRQVYVLESSVFVNSGLSHMKRLNLWTTNTTFSLSIPPGEVSKLPIGGIWESTLVFRVDRDATKEPESRAVVHADVQWTVNVTVRVTDNSHIQVYLPEFGEADARVDLALRGHPHAGGPGSALSGHRVIDACLYDGYNSQSQRYEITASDPLSTNNAFHVRHESPITPGDASEHIVYRVFATDPSTGAPHEFLSGQKNTFQGVNTAGWRMVRLPFNPFPVVCTPWPITLETPAFPSNGKHAGQYSGVLRIEFTPSTTSP